MATATQKRKINQITAHQDSKDSDAAKKLSKRNRIQSNKNTMKSDDAFHIDPLPAHIYNLLEKHEMSNDTASQELVKNLHKLQEKRQRKGRTNFEVASALNVVGSFLYHQEDFNNAVVFFQEELRIEESLMCCESLSLAVTCNNIGKIHQETGRFQQAINYYHRALKNTESAVHGACDDDQEASENKVMAVRLCSTVWYNLGFIYDKLRKHDKAIEAFQMSLQFRKQVHGTAHADVACLFFNIAVLQMERKLLKAANSSMKEFLQIRKLIRSCTISDGSLITTLKRLASLQKSNGKIAQSLETLREVLLIQRDSTELEPAQRRLDMGTTFRKVAELYHEQDQLSFAMIAAEKSVQLLKGGSPSEFFAAELVSSLLLLGSLTQESSKPIRARSIFFEAVHIIDTTSSSRIDYVPSPLDTLREVSFMLATSNCAPVA